MKILGQYDTNGQNFAPYTAPREVVQLGNTLRDPSDGGVLAVKDEYGDWVSPTLKSLGLKSIIKVGE